MVFASEAISSFVWKRHKPERFSTNLAKTKAAPQEEGVSPSSPEGIGLRVAHWGPRKTASRKKEKVCHSIEKTPPAGPAKHRLPLESGLGLGAVSWMLHVH